MCGVSTARNVSDGTHTDAYHRPPTQIFRTQYGLGSNYLSMLRVKIATYATKSKMMVDVSASPAFAADPPASPWSKQIMISGGLTEVYIQEDENIDSKVRVSCSR